MTEPASMLVGRAGEQAAVAAFLTRNSPAAARVLLVEGEAGVGKSALLTDAIDTAVSAGWQIRISRPTENEARFAYVGLADLLDGTDVDLPAPQRLALDVALRRATTDTALDPHAVTLATIGHLSGGTRPVLLVVDDVPWLDAATATVLAAVVRRLPGERVRLLLTRRTRGPDGSGGEPAGGPDGFPWQLDRHLPPDACRTLKLTGLDPGALHELLRRRLGVRLRRSAVAQIHAISRGNPFYALHLAREGRRAGPDGHAGGPVGPLPRPLAELVAARLDAVPPADREVMLTVAALAVPNLSRLRAAHVPAGEALVSEAVDAAVERAEAAGLLVVAADGRLSFEHPLTASVLYGSAPAPQRRAVHRRLARVEPEPEAQARHLALGTLGPDEEVARCLDRAAHDARLRGASHVAAELLGLAHERGVGTNDRRAVSLAECLLETGDAEAAGETLDRLLPGMAPGPLRAEALFLRGTAAWFTGNTGASDHLRAAVDDAAGAPELQGRIFSRLAVFRDDNAEQARGYAAMAVAALEDAGAKDPLAGALCMLFYAEIMVGADPRPELLERAVALEDPRGDPDHSTVPGIWALALDRPDEARARYQTLLDRDRARGDLSAESDLLNKLAEVAIWADDWDTARTIADAAVRSARQLGDSNADPSVRQRLLLDAHQGRLDDVGPTALARADELAPAGEPLLAAAYLAVAAFVAASAGDSTRVVELTARAAGHFAAIGVVEPVGRLDPAAERMEALAQSGRLEEAEALLAAVRIRLERIPRPWLEAAWRRAAAEHAAATGDPAGAADLAEPPRGARPFDRARTLLTRGRLLRRARRVTAAEQALAEAAEIFDRLGARAWSTRVTAERSRLGLRRETGDGLTPTELRVARLAAGGSTNRTVAEELTMSPKTVEAHLARVYRKLGIRSRAELGARLASGRLPADG